MANKITFKRIATVMLAIAVITTSVGLLQITDVYAASSSSVKLGQACNDENGNVRGGKAGDQTGQEVTITKWSHSGGASNWTFVARANDVAVAKKIAEGTIAVCNNDHVGYDQNNRAALYNAAEANDWNFETITTNVECTCGTLVAAVCTAAGVPIDKNASSGNLRKYIEQSGAFTIYTSSDYTSSTKNLRPGDILCAEGVHSAVVVESPNALCYTIEYSNASGEKQSEEIEIGSKIVVNTNNGKESTVIIVDENKDLDELASDKNGFSRSGWVKTSKNTYSASCKSDKAAIRTDFNDEK